MSSTLEIAIFLSMNGRADEAIAFYKRHLHAKELMRVTYLEMAKVDDSILLTDENKNFISHSVLLIGRTKVMIAEENMNVSEGFVIGNNFSLCIQSAVEDEIRQFYENLLTDSRVSIILPLAANSFSPAYGILEDPFGVQIQFMYDKRLR